MPLISFPMEFSISLFFDCHSYNNNKSALEEVAKIYFHLDFFLGLVVNWNEKLCIVFVQNDGADK